MGQYLDSFEQVDAKVIDTVKRIKSLSVLKNSLEKLLSEAGETKPEQKTQAPKSETPKAEKSKPEKKTREVKPLKATASDDDITGAVVTFLEMIKARPGNLLSKLWISIFSPRHVLPQHKLFIIFILKFVYFPFSFLQSTWQMWQTNNSIESNKPSRFMKKAWVW